jgi:hypothetical protein
LNEAHARAAQRRRRRLTLFLLSFSAWLPACSAQTHVVGRTCDPTPRAALPLPVDLLVVLDASVAMATGTLWPDVRAGLIEFATGDPLSATAGTRRIGFALHPAQVPCASDDECGAPAQAGSCVGNSACLAVGGGSPIRCAGITPACPAQGACHARGTCTVSQLPCLVGQPCPGVAAADVCVAQSFCTSAAVPACDARLFGHLDVPIGSPAVAAPAIATLLPVRDPVGLPTLAPTLEAIYKGLRAAGQTDPGRRAAVVVVGHAGSFAPSTCPSTSTTSAMALAQAAQEATPPITTHMVDVKADGLEGPAVLASAGGGVSISISNPERLAADLGPALHQIEASARACEFALPDPVSDKGSTTWTVWLATAGASQPVMSVVDANACPPAGATPDGWYRRAGDAASAALAVLCPSTCARFRADQHSAITLAQICPVDGGS